MADMGKLLPTHLLKEVLMAHEEAELERVHSTARVAFTGAARFLQERKEAVQKFTAAPPAAKAKLGVKKVKKGIWPVPKWTSSTPANEVADATAFLCKHLPPDTSCRADLKYGRWNISYAGYRHRQVSWTRRGVDAAVHLALLTAWGFHTEAADEGPRWSVLELEKVVGEKTSGSSASSSGVAAWH